MVTFSIYWSTCKEAAVGIQGEVKDMSWDTIILTILLMFLILRTTSSLFAGSPPEPPPAYGVRPATGFHYRPPLRPGNAGGGALGDLENRIGNFQDVNDQDRVRPGAAGRDSAAESGTIFSRARSQIQRLRRSAQNPMDVFSKCLEEIMEYGDWPFTGDVSVRLAAEYLAPIYGTGRRGVFYARQYVHDHGMEGTHLGAVFERIFAILDELILYDRQNALNLASGEYLARWAYAIEKATAQCSKKEHMSGERKALKTRWDLFSYYDIWSVAKKNSGVESADSRVTDTMKRDALFMKYLERVQTGS
jgi:hypothetical protein